MPRAAVAAYTLNAAMAMATGTHLRAVRGTDRKYDPGRRQATESRPHPSRIAPAAALGARPCGGRFARWANLRAKAATTQIPQEYLDHGASRPRRSAGGPQGLW